MSSLQIGSPGPGARPPLWLLLAVSAVVSLCLSCTTVRVQAQPTWGEPQAAGGSRFNQSCAACAVPAAGSTGELAAPAATRLGAAVEKVIEAAETARGFLAIQRLLTEAELAEVEGVIKLCVAQAHADVNESFQKQDGGYKFENGKFPSDAECLEEVGVDEDGEPVTLAQELGTLKHAAAFACIKARLPVKLHGQFSIEPRYKGNPKVNGTVLTNNRPGSLKPDVVLHATRNATNIQCVYELKFPCLESQRLAPMASSEVRAQLESYEPLSGGCRVVLVTPAGFQQYGVE